MTQATVLLLLKVFDGFMFAVEHAPALIAKWRGHIGLIKTLINEQRDPTDAEWQTVEDTAKSQTDALRAVVEADNG